MFIYACTYRGFVASGLSFIAEIICCEVGYRWTRSMSSWCNSAMVFCEDGQTCREWESHLSPVSHELYGPQEQCISTTVTFWANDHPLTTWPSHMIHMYVIVYYIGMFELSTVLFPWSTWLRYISLGGLDGTLNSGYRFKTFGTLGHIRCLDRMWLGSTGGWWEVRRIELNLADLAKKPMDVYGTTGGHVQGFPVCLGQSLGLDGFTHRFMLWLREFLRVHLLEVSRCLMRPSS